MTVGSDDIGGLRQAARIARRPRRTSARRTIVMVGVTALVAVLAPGLPAIAGPPDVTVSLTQSTGIAPFNSDDGPGHDSSPDNSVVRTDDLTIYHVSISAAATVTNAKITFALPAGEQMWPTSAGVPPQFANLGAPPALPAFCGPGSSVTPTLSDPVVPITTTSWQSLTSQTVTCTVPDLTPGPAHNFDFTAMVRPEMPNASTLAVSGATVSGQNGAGAVSATSNKVSATVSAASKWNIGINGAMSTPNSAFVKQGVIQPCAAPGIPKFNGDGTKALCVVAGLPVTISIPDGGKGGVPVVNGDFQFQVNVDPATTWGSQAAGKPLAAYGGWLGSGATTCDAPNYQTVNPKIAGGGATAVNSARNSGTVTCTQPGGPGTPIIIKTTGMDSSGFTIPTDFLAPAGKTWTAQGYVFSARVWVEWPYQGVLDYGTRSAGGISAPVTATVSDPVEQDIDGSPNLAGSDIPDDSYRTFNVSFKDTMVATNFWAGIPNAPTATPPSVFVPSYPVWTGPPGPAGMNTGDGVAVAGQHVIDAIQLVGQVQAQGASTLSCVAIDPTRSALANFTVPTNQPGDPAEMVVGNDNQPIQGSSGGGQQSGPVWITGSMVDFQEMAGGVQQFNDRFGLLSNGERLYAQYSATGSGGGANTRCDANSGAWYDDPAAVPGNDPALAAAGVYTGVRRVRVLVQNLPATGGNPTQRTTIAIGMQVMAGGVTGEVIPTWLGYTSAPGLQTMATMAAANPPTGWTTSSYDPAVNTPVATDRSGDRLKLTVGLGSVTKSVEDPASGSFVQTDTWVPSSQQWQSKSSPAPYANPPLYTAGDVITYHLQPTLRADTAAVFQQGLIIEDCLPVNSVYVGATLGGSPIQPVVLSGSAPADAALACGANQAYVRWDLGQRTINQAIPLLEVRAKVLETAPNGPAVNTAVASAGGDASRIDVRMSKATVTYNSPAGLRVSKSTSTPLVQVGPGGLASPAAGSWQITARNVAVNGVAQSVGDVDVIDVLPATGQNGSTFAGAGLFVSAAATAGTGITLWYSKTPRASVAADPADPTNSPGGATLWCSAPAGGTVTSGSGTAAGCPASPREVNAVRMLRPGQFGASDAFAVTMTTSAAGNLPGDVMINQVAARATGVTTLVGPSQARVDFVAGTASVSGSAWNDTNRDGYFQPSEPVLPGTTVTLTSTDAYGNPIALTTQTAADGSYRFNGLPSGSYTVSFTAPPGMSPTQVLAANGASLPVSVGIAAPVTLGSGQVLSDVDSGFVALPPAPTPTAPAAPPASVPSGAPDRLAYTGANTLLPLGVGAALLALGALVTVATLRRRPRRG